MLQREGETPPLRSNIFLKEYVMATTATTGAKTAVQVTTQAQRKRGEALTAYGFMAPAMIVLVVFMIIPMLVGLYFSFTNWNGIRPLNTTGAYEFVGLQNYQSLLVSGRRVADFYTALKNTVYYVLGVVPTQTLIALTLAVILNQKWLKGRGFFRTAFYFPSITSSVVISLIFVFLFTRGGPVNGLLQAIFPNFRPVTWLDNADGIIHNFLGLFGVTKATVGSWANTEVFRISLWEWISGPSVTLLMIMLLAIWTTIGTMMVIYLAALQNIPGQVFEAATVDGATAWQTFRYITLPLLRPTTFFVVTIGLIGTFQVFDQVYIVSKGEPQDTTLTIAYLVYRNAFDPQGPQMGLASATAIVLFVIIFVFTLLQRRITGSDKADN
jgi:multiple sugar transport system permease protein